MSENEGEGIVAAFDRALQLRDNGEFAQSLELLRWIISASQTLELDFLAQVHLQAANMCGKLGLPDDAEAHFFAASTMDPRLELASVGYFLALFARGEFTAAAREMHRFVRVMNSEMYRELLCPNYEDGIPEPAATIVRAARNHLYQNK